MSNLFRFLALTRLSLFCFMAYSLSFTDLVIASPTEYFKLAPSKQESYSESFTLVSRLEDQSYLLVQAMIMNGGIGDEKPGCRILYVPQGRSALNQVEKGDDWVYSKVDDRLRLGTCTLTRTANGLTWEAQTQDINLKLELRGQLKQMSHSALQMKVEKDSYFAKILMPNAQVNAQIKLKGKSLGLKRGRGVLNHVRSTILPPKLASRWFKLYAFSASELKSFQAKEAPFIIMDVRYPPKDQKSTAEAWWWSNQHKSIQPFTALPPLLQNTLKDRALKMGDWLELDAVGRVEVTHLTPIFKYEPVRAYGFMGRMLKSWIGDPLNQSSLLTLKTDQGSMLGIVEEITFR